MKERAKALFVTVTVIPATLARCHWLSLIIWQKTINHLKKSAFLWWKEWMDKWVNEWVIHSLQLCGQFVSGRKPQKYQHSRVRTWIAVTIERSYLGSRNVESLVQTWSGIAPPLTRGAGVWATAGGEAVGVRLRSTGLRSSLLVRVIRRLPAPGTLSVGPVGVSSSPPPPPPSPLCPHPLDWTRAEQKGSGGGPEERQRGGRHGEEVMERERPGGLRRGDRVLIPSSRVEIAWEGRSLWESCEGDRNDRKRMVGVRVRERESESSAGFQIPFL